MSDTPQSIEVLYHDLYTELQAIHRQIKAELNAAPTNPTVVEEQTLARRRVQDEALTKLFIELQELEDESDQPRFDDLYRSIMESEFPGHTEWSG